MSPSPINQTQESEMYTKELKVVKGSFPRKVGSAIPQDTARNPLKICYRKYHSKDGKINLVFLHGTGMNKGLWHYHIDKLYHQYENTKTPIGTVLAIDMVNHGHSAALNIDRLGYKFDWCDGARDVQCVLQNEIKSFTTPGQLNILVGHSMGGFISLFTTFLQPTLFHSVVVVNPVAYTTDQAKEGSTIVFNGWVKKGYMKDDFHVSKYVKGEIPPEVYEFFENKSFFRNFDKRILKNQLDDEIPDREHNGDINLHTTMRNQLITYFGSFDAIPVGMEIYSTIKTPVYYILSENDTTNSEAVQYLESSMKDVIHRIDVPEAYHIVNAEQPDLMVDILIKIIDERLDMDHDKLNTEINEEKLLVEKFGKSYRQEFLKRIFDPVQSIINGFQ
ncbi:peroxisomal membrane protein Lpx1p [[Candida] anglica]|uniref:Peroxisomal membrane protein Lpx1p n=1 Tax=[Candida] anglica TaxID=148631 RepID=A0ABP0EG39_9ASCO